MLSQKQIKEIKEHLERAQNPVFFFHNDADGLCSFLLLRKYLGRGRGVSMKLYNKGYFRRVKELDADYVFILDVPVVPEEFFEEARQVNVPVVWIDHHPPGVHMPDFVEHYNPSREPVTALCYQITNRKEDMWLATAGCIADHFIPDFYSEFKKKYPDLAIDSENVKEIYYRSGLGKIGRLFNAGLKDKTTNVVNMLRFLMNVRTPYEVLEEGKGNKEMYRKFKEVEDKIEHLLKDVDVGDEKTLFFEYGGEMSLSSDLSQVLKYRFPDKIIFVAYISGENANLSIRGEGVKELLLETLKDFENAIGGGHEKAVGGRIRLKDLEKFKKKFSEFVKKRKV